MTLSTVIFFCKPSIYVITNDTNGMAEFLGFAGLLKSNKDLKANPKALDMSYENGTLTVLVEANES